MRLSALWSLTSQQLLKCSSVSLGDVLTFNSYVSFVAHIFSDLNWVGKNMVESACALFFLPLAQKKVGVITSSREEAYF